jgi:hypothetical protein
MDDVFNDDEDGSEGNEKGQVRLGIWPSNKCPKTGGLRGFEPPDRLHAMQPGFVCQRRAASGYCTSGPL